jgi:kelch-like protein 10
MITETLTYLRNLHMTTKKRRKIPVPKIARPRIPHEILFAVGGWNKEGLKNSIETYEARTDRWIKVSCTQLYYTVPC